MTKVRFDVKHAKIWVNFNTQSEERNSFNNTHTLTMYFDVDADIAIAGLVFSCLLFIITYIIII